MKQKDILIILILLFVGVIAWIGSSIYHNSVTTTISENTSQDISPIAPNFDTTTINALKQRKGVIPVFELGSAAPTPTPLIFPTPIISPSTNASPEGELDL